MTPDSTPSTVESYRMTVPGKRLMPIRPMVHGPDPGPIQGESLLGLVTRTAARNGFDGLSRVVRLADIQTLRVEALPTIHALADGAADRLAFVLNVPTIEIGPRCHPPVDRDAAAGFVDFHGVAVRAAYREGGRRRVSPLSLRASPHHRAIWDLLPFGFCPESMESLIDACPVCRKPLRWRRTVGIPFCESCVDDEGDPTVDLREHPGHVFEVADMEALRLATGIVDPDPTRRVVARKLLPSVFDGFTEGDIFEAIVALACAITTDPGASRGIMRRMKTLADFSRITPEALALAARTLICWPNAFHELAERVRGQAEQRDGHYGVRKELGPLLMLTRDPHLAPTMKEMVRAEIDTNMAATSAIAAVRRVDNHREEEWITVQAAAARFGINRKMLGKLADELGARRVEGAVRSPVLLRVAQVERFAAERADLMPASTAAIRLGLPSVAVAGLAQAGMIRRLDGPVLKMVVGDVYYARSSVEALVSDLLERARTGTAPRSGSIRLSKAAKRLGGGQQPWPAILAAIVAGDLAVHLVPGDNAALTTQVGIVGMEAIVRVVNASGAPPPVDAAGNDRINRSEAAALLGTHEPMVGALVAHGLLPSSGHAYCSLRRADVEAFRAAFVLGGELARTMGVRKRDVRTVLEARGVMPVASAMAKGGLVWRRETVTALLKIS